MSRPPSPADWAITQRILEGESLADAEAYWGIKAWRLRARVLRTCAYRNPVLYAHLATHAHVLLTALRRWKVCFGCALSAEENP